MLVRVLVLALALALALALLKGATPTLQRSCWRRLWSLLRRRRRRRRRRWRRQLPWTRSYSPRRRMSTQDYPSSTRIR